MLKRCTHLCMSYLECISFLYVVASGIAPVLISPSAPHNSPPATNPKGNLNRKYPGPIRSPEPVRHPRAEPTAHLKRSQTGGSAFRSGLRVGQGFRADRPGQVRLGQANSGTQAQGAVRRRRSEAGVQTQAQAGAGCRCRRRRR
jgi:hypothetical protein